MTKGMTMNKTAIALGIALVSIACYARPMPLLQHRSAPHHPPVVRHPPRQIPPPRHYHHYHSTWGRGGCNFWPGFTAGVIGSLLVPRLPPPPPRPVVYVNQIWVPPVYETRPVYDVFGNIIRYEQVLVRVGYWR